MAANGRVFHVGLNMAGAVSAGAYTAGVIDFLIDALDSLYRERQAQEAKYGDDFSRWEIPAHEVRLAVMSGASAGGMTSAIAAASLCEEFTPVRRPLPASAPNRLYQAWVEDIDISHLLGGEDLLKPDAPVVSILDSTQIDKIADEAVRVTRPLPAKRPYVADPLKVVLTLTNLGGIPYAIEANQGNAETQTLYRADQSSFEVRWDGKAEANLGVTLSPHSNQSWSELGDAAKATGAFPIALAPRRLNRTTTMYNERQWRFSVAEPVPADGRCQCECMGQMKPNWTFADGVAFHTLNVDGGVTNNDPFECAHQELLQQKPVQNVGHNTRSGAEADRAVISIAPFLSTPAYHIHKMPGADLPSLLGELLDTLINQSRIQGENIRLTEDPNVFSRWAISPSIDETTRSALASAALGAFGGFFAKEFRDHDYQLGRRNCQWFLRQHFGVPLDNVVVKEYAPRKELLKNFGMQLPDGSEGIALIPLVDPLNSDTHPIPEVAVKIPHDRLLGIADLAMERLKLIASRLLLKNANLLESLGFKAVWFAAEGPIKRTLLQKMGYELARQNLLQ